MVRVKEAAVAVGAAVLVGAKVGADVVGAMVGADVVGDAVGLVVGEGVGKDVPERRKVSLLIPAPEAIVTPSESRRVQRDPP